MVLLKELSHLKKKKVKCIHVLLKLGDTVRLRATMWFKE